MPRLTCSYCGQVEVPMVEYNEELLCAVCLRQETASDFLLDNITDNEDREEVDRYIAAYEDDWRILI